MRPTVLAVAVLALTGGSVVGSGQPRGSADGPATLRLTHSLVKLRQPPSPPPLRDPSPLALYSAQNEYESFQAVVSAGSDPAVVSELRVAHDSLPELGVAVYREATINITLVTNCEGGAGEWPDALIPDVDVYAGEKRAAFPVRLAPRQSVVFWVDLFVPPNSTAGSHQLSVTLTTAAAAATGAVVALEVAPFSFPSTATLATAFGALHVAPKGHGLPQGTAVGNELVRKYADAMLMHRLSGDFLEVEALSLEQQFSNWTHFWGDFFSEEGRDLPFGLKGARVTTQSLPAPFCVETTPIKLPHETKVAGFNCTSTPALTSRQREYWRAVFKQMVDRWPRTAEVLFDYTVDEPQAHEDIFGQQRWEILRDRAQLVHEADPRIRRMVTAEIEIVANAHQSLLGAIDIWCPYLNAIDGRGTHANCTMMASLNESGNQITHFPKNVSTISDYATAKTLWMYQACPSIGCGGHGCGPKPAKDPVSGIHSECLEGWPAFFVIDHPAVSARIMQWADFANGVTGELYWGVLGQYGSVKTAPNLGPAQLWETQWLNGANGDGNLFYPGTPELIGGRTHIPVESIRLKLLRDGVEDYELLRLAERLLGRAKVLALMEPTFRNLGAWTREPLVMLATRRAIGEAIANASPGRPLPG